MSPNTAGAEAAREAALQGFSLTGKVALVTGAGRGIGQAIAVALAQVGARVALVARSDEQLTQTMQRIGEFGGESVAIPYDLAANDDFSILIDTVEQRLGGVIDNVVHAAGMQFRREATEFPRAEWDRVIHLNLTVPFLLSREVGKRQLAAGRAGNHIFIASLASAIGLNNVIAYNASKSGVMGIVRGLNKEWSAHGIRVNAIAPGYIETAMTADLFADDTKRSGLFAQIPMGRFGVPEDFVGPAVFLASPASAYVTGHLLFVDGGASAA